MRTPPSRKEANIEDTFSSAHERAREAGYTGTIETVGEETGGAVLLKGAVVYARCRDEISAAALSALRSRDCSPVRSCSSTPETVRMFRTYLRYLSDEGLLTTEPLDYASIESHEVEGVIVDGVKNTTDTDSLSTMSSMSARANMPDRSFFPEGVRTALAPDLDSLHRHIADHEATGYAAGNGETITFYEGNIVDRKRVDLPRAVREEVGAGEGWVVVNSDVDENEDRNNDGVEKGGVLSRIF